MRLSRVGRRVLHECVEVCIEQDEDHELRWCCYCMWLFKHGRHCLDQDTTKVYCFRGLGHLHRQALHLQHKRSDQFLSPRHGTKAWHLP